ncbi:Phosphatidate phosphatase LPIN2 [Acropora cervicornis]|uniref:Phosphatidate phosphatase LPIN2 n=1 Tax=Acropora cervicornis TaxID=6130 RepID=A0AAD9QF97_ACRCE|nr:Phosphatidate phosphatase LPIN2 [Acropora cervicornis]
MKLGEAGEAFFVEELENGISDSLGSSLPSSKRHVENQKDDDLSNEENSGNTTICMEGNTSNIGAKLLETTAQGSCETSVITDREDGGVLGKDDAANDSGTDDQAIDVQSDKAVDDNHSDPETGEVEESLLLSIKEPASADSTWQETDCRSIGNSGYSREFYPLSDMDSPIGTPTAHRDEILHPPEPEKYLSDSEVELKQSQESISRENEIRWAWGKLPQGPEGSFLPDRKPSEMRKEDMKHVHKIKKREASYKSHHKVKGLVCDLSDCCLITGLDSNLQQQQSGSGSEDRESGIGQSLPCSPSVGERNKDTELEEYHDIAMSLCGELKNGKVPLESFIQSMVTFDDLSSNPALLSDPKLVIRINDRYYNWQIAAPMLVSHVLFQRPLKQETCQSLVKQHMPKKEKRRSYRNMYYWFPWRANEEKSSDEENEDIKKDKPRPRVHSSSSRKQVNLQETEIDGEPENTNSDRQRKISQYNSGNESDVPKKNYRKVTRLSSEQIGTALCTATIYMWNYNDKIVISDIDGTITKSDVLGQILPVLGQAWAQSGVAQFFGKIQQNGYKVLYLSARAIGQAQQTRDYLKSVKQDQLMLPDGPLLLSPESLIKAFHREVIEKKPEEFKISCLRDIQSLFPTNRNPFYAGFGNKVNDVLSYRAVGIAVSRIFTINHRVRQVIVTQNPPYIKLSDLVDQMFPPFKTEPSGLIAPDQFSSFTYWRAPLPNITLDDIDLTSDVKMEAATP